MKERTKKFTIDCSLLCSKLPNSREYNAYINQLIRCSCSVGANYRAACRGRSKAEFFSKICIVVEEADESEYWLELIDETNLSSNPIELNRLKLEINEIVKIMSKAKNTAYQVK